MSSGEMKRLYKMVADGAASDELPTPLSDDEIADLVETSKADGGAPFEADTLARIVATKRTSLAAFVRLRARLKEAKVLVSELDKALADGDGDAGDDAGGQGTAIAFPEIEPWRKPVDGAELLDDIFTNVKRYVRFQSDAHTIAVALWVAHAYSFHLFPISPRLAITSPEKRCGKTTLLRIVQNLVPRALAASNITSAAMFRTIEAHRPTLLIDEADTFMKDNEDLRGVINSGHERDGCVIRVVGEDHEPRAFSTFCPTAIAAIGSLPGTIEDRAFMIAMRRKLRTELTEKFRSDRVAHLHDLRRKAARWVADHDDELREADPAVPEALHDRAADNWRAALAIADIAGGSWPAKARAAALELSDLGGEGDDTGSRGVMLLSDIHTVFAGRARRKLKDADRVSSTDLAIALAMLDDRPWATWSHGRPISTRGVVTLLRPYGIFPNTIQLADNTQPNGYRRDKFEDAWRRYMPLPQENRPQSSPSSQTPAKPGVYEQNRSSPEGGRGEDRKSAQPIEKYGVLEDREDKSPQSRAGGIAARPGDRSERWDIDAWKQGRTAANDDGDGDERALADALCRIGGKGV